MDTCLDKIRSRIAKSDDNELFSPSDFFDIGNPKVVERDLDFLSQENVIAKLCPGIYAKPYESRVGIIIDPDSWTVANKIGKNNGWIVAPGTTIFRQIIHYEGGEPADGFNVFATNPQIFISSGPDAVYYIDWLHLTLRFEHTDRDLSGLGMNTIFILNGIENSQDIFDEEWFFGAVNDLFDTEEIEIVRQEIAKKNGIDEEIRDFINHLTGWREV